MREKDERKARGRRGGMKVKVYIKEEVEEDRSKKKKKKEREGDVRSHFPALGRSSPFFLFFGGNAWKYVGSEGNSRSLLSSVLASGASRKIKNHSASVHWINQSPAFFFLLLLPLLLFSVFFCFGVSARAPATYQSRGLCSQPSRLTDLGLLACAPSEVRV